MKLLDLMAVLVLIFWGASILFPVIAVPIYNPPAVYKVCLYLHPHQPLLFAVLEYLVMGWCLMDLIWNSLIINDADHLFVCRLAVCLSFLEKSLLRVSAQLGWLLVLFVCFLMLSCMSSLYILDINSLDMFIIQQSAFSFCW